MSDTEFEYDGNTQIGDLTDGSTDSDGKHTPASYGNFGISLNGVALEPGVDYAVTRFVRLSDNKTVAADDVVDAGSYAAVIQGVQGGRFDGSSATVKFEVSALDLSKAVIVVDDITAGDYAEASGGNPAGDKEKYSYDGSGNVVDTSAAGFAASSVDADESKEKALEKDFEIATINGKPISDFADLSGESMFIVSDGSGKHGPIEVRDGTNTDTIGYKYVQGKYTLTVNADASVNAYSYITAYNTGASTARTRK